MGFSTKTTADWPRDSSRSLPYLSFNLRERIWKALAKTSSFYDKI